MSCADEMVVALYDYSANDAEELSIKKSEQLVLLDAKNMWWKVRNNNMKVGLVPSNYLRRDKSKGESLINRFANKFPGKKARSGSTTSNHNPASNNMSRFDPNSQKLLVGGQTAVPANLVTRTALNEYYVSRFNFQASKNDELSLTKNMRVLVLQVEGDGWWLGRDADPGSNGAEGWFPSNYVVKETVHQNAVQSQNRTVPAPRPLQPSAGGTATPDLVCVVRALYAFNSGNPEELAFEADEMLDVIEDPVNDPEWWYCKNQNNKTGLVPKNYVEVVQYGGGLSASAGAGGPREINYDPVTPQSSTSAAAAAIAPAVTAAAVTAVAATPTPQNGSGNVNEDWFFGSLTRAQAEDMLKSRAQTGEFLVRNSETSTGDFSISMKMDERIRHFKVIVHDGVYKIGQKRFDSMEMLLEHYKQSPIFTNNQGRAYLTVPMPR